MGLKLFVAKQAGREQYRFGKPWAIALGLGGLWLSGGWVCSLSATSVELPPVSQPDLPLRRVERVALSDSSATRLGWDDQIWGEAGGMGDRQRLLSAIHQSLIYLQTPAAEQAYADYPVPGITRDRVQRSLERFRELLLTCQSAAELQAAVQAEFEIFQAVGVDGAGTVHVTGYFEPTYAASRYPTQEYRYPLYRRPLDLEDWSQPHPTRLDLEGRDGLRGYQGPLRGYELVWLRDRLEAFLVHVQGSARLQLTDGSALSVGYAGRTEYPYRSLGRMLIDDGKLPAEGLTLPQVLDYFRQHPAELDTYLPRNDRFVFFKETAGGPPTGSLRVPVTAERSIATDKLLMPPGALALLSTSLPFPVSVPPQPLAPSLQPTTQATSLFEWRDVSRYVLDQDTGGAIQGPGRVDVFMGTGQIAGDRAGLMNTSGTLYYLLLN